MRARLLFWLLAAWSLAGVLAAVISYRTAEREAGELFDRHLKQIALSLRDQPFEDQDILGTLEEESDYDFVIEVWDASRTKLYSSHSEARVPQSAIPGYSYTERSGETWRTFVLNVDGTNIQIAQPMAVRRARAANLALRTVTPFLVLLPLMGLLIWFTVSKGLAPLVSFTRAIGQRDHNRLADVSMPQLPAELQPMERELNQLIARLRIAMDAQRAFTADAAHELRTPLTAVQLQAQLAERAQDPVTRAEAFDKLRAGLRRSVQLVRQLLELARAENAGQLQHSAISMSELINEVVVSLTDMADRKQIDLGINCEDGAMIEADRSAIRTLISNLVENAIQYTQTDGKIDVSATCSPAGTLIEVTDNGPGIPDSDKARVFDRFHRGENALGSHTHGSGLGLAIVQAIARQHGAIVRLLDGPSGRGLCVQIQFANIARRQEAVTQE